LDTEVSARGISGVCLIWFNLSRLSSEMGKEALQMGAPVFS